MQISLHTYDLPDDFIPGPRVAIDTEAMGLKNHRDRLCLVQLSNGDGKAHLVQFPTPDFSKSPNLIRLLTDSNIQKIFHFARFDVCILSYSFQLTVRNIYCTKMASKLVRTYTDKHGLKDLLKDLLSVEISKQEQSSDWGRPILSKDQQRYAANDVLHLHKLVDALNPLLEREKRTELAQACFDFLPYRAHLDLMTGEEYDIFKYKSE